MKKNFKKLVATSLAIATFTSTTYTFAIKPAFPEPKHAITENTPDLASCVREFESLAPGVFYVEPDFVNANPILAHKIINQIIKIFKKYPKITRKFIDRIIRTTEQKFTIRAYNEEAILISSIPSLGLFKNLRDPRVQTSGFYDERPEKVDLFINIRCLPEHKSLFAMMKQTKMFPRDLAENLISVDDPSIITDEMLKTDGKTQTIADELPDFEEGIVSHEIGHLIFNLLAFCGNEDLYLKFVTSLTSYNQEICKLMKSNPDIWQMKTFMDSSGASELYHDVLPKHIKMKEQIMNIARTKYGYEGDGFISKYGARCEAEWQAEVFAHAMCSRTPNPLGKAMLEYLDNFENSL